MTNQSILNLQLKVGDRVKITNHFYQGSNRDLGTVMSTDCGIVAIHWDGYTNIIQYDCRFVDIMRKLTPLEILAEAAGGL